MAEQNSNVRYQELVNEDEPAQPPQEGAAQDAPPPYSSIAAANAAFFEYKEDGSRFPNPPSYSVATTLPSYDEAERSKEEAAIPLVPGRVTEDDFVARDDFEDADQLRIGNDGIFMLTFFMAFLFNWIGFFLSFCLTTSAAGRYGAISGFGLSLIKWVLIVRFSTYFPGYFDGQYWLWWVFLALGFMLSSEASLTTPGCVSWRTPRTPLCPGQGSSSSIRGCWKWDWARPTGAVTLRRVYKLK
ncbi:NEDD4 family-interacting protein 1 [Dissostichus eleginoides]|uniref:NEDD4 family-interacting protein 1 n=1 Tax=Dissostichus eleginoides TaxID=100907 RepID=A0AAD9CKN3_DISEL|nr:NEDD4 family-interacting protein 1 [Dissostichus eleginoides]